MNCNFDISVTDVKNYFLQAGDIVYQAGTGLLGGHTINYINQWLHPGKVILGKPPVPLIDPFQAGVCSLTFAVTDFLAKQIFEKYLGVEFSNKPLCQVIRMAGTIALSALVTSACLHITFTLAATAIVTSIVASAIIMGLVILYNAMVHPAPVTDQERIILAYQNNLLRQLELAEMRAAAENP